MDIVSTLISTIIVASVVLIIIKYRTKLLPPTRHNDDFDVGPQYKEKPDPQQIMDEISKLSPVQSQDPSRNYRGLFVKWHVTYKSASMRNLDGTMDLWFSPRSSKPYFLVVCAVNLEQYPRMETMKAGHEMWLAGTIESVYPPTMIRLAPGAILKI